VIVFQSSFADSSMVIHVAETIDAPLLLWAIPEAPNGDRLRLNALCGVNLAAHALTREGYRYTTIYAETDDPEALEMVRTTALAGRALRLLRSARVVRVGENPPGFASCLMNPETLKSRLGVDIVQVELENLRASARGRAGRIGRGPRVLECAGRGIGRT
jgi:L-fucose isomerase-like protein